ncbi:MAG TPA: hypothetical protein PLD51_05035 [Pontiellaceae bacterium]|nr:hypothetical protein [Pontiellaceae bacterium]
MGAKKQNNELGGLTPFLSGILIFIAVVAGLNGLWHFRDPILRKLLLLGYWAIPFILFWVIYRFLSSQLSVRSSRIIMATALIVPVLVTSDVVFVLTCTPSDTCGFGDALLMICPPIFVNIPWIVIIMGIGWWYNFYKKRSKGVGQ